MEDIKSIYKNLTSVDIEAQKRLWNERGKGYYGEYLLFTDLYKHIKGQCKILMNLNIPTENGRTTEIDLLLIHESGLYVFECKHYKGTIYGNLNDNTWTQYFRTQKNNSFKSPIKQNEYHISAIRQLYPNIPVYSYIVFTNPEAEIKITGLEKTEIIVCNLSDVGLYFHGTSASKVLSAAQIDEIFTRLRQYAPEDQVGPIPGNEPAPVPFVDYINKIKSDYAEAKEKTESEQKEIYRQKRIRIKGLAIAFSAIIFLISFIIVGGALINEQKAKQKLDDFSQRFQEAKPLNDGKIHFEDNFVEILDRKISKLPDIKEAYEFSCKIKVNGTQYGLHFIPSTSIIVQMKDGTVTEYNDLKSSSAFYNTYVGPFLGWNNQKELPTIQIYATSADDIAYIKLVNVSIADKASASKDVLKGMEIELYSAK